ncbi:hypothetical protein EYC84_006595 [Monilinia fructicola]|uniref:Rhodopsin domain-containing protein n=1 Tax=Monilinia fructicola TaxID=38448 RepID=A0A5M9K8S9_MONFR|nr:hypothetical protein EYC84_006595 [Monilinia fructicola]
MASPTLTPIYLAQNAAVTLNTVIWTFAILTLIFVVSRVYVRVYIKESFGVDDVFAVLATAVSISCAAMTSSATKRGLGRHIEYVESQNPDFVNNIASSWDIGATFFIITCALGKTSFAITLLRIVVVRWMKILLWFLIITNNIVNILTVLFIFVQCNDIRHIWNPEIPSTCWPAQIFPEFVVFVGAYSGLQDFVLALLPWAITYNLKMDKKVKIFTTIGMSLEIFAGVAAIVKTMTLFVFFTKSRDFTWALPPLLGWATAENSLAIIASSVPALLPLVKYMYPRNELDPDAEKGISFIGCRVQLETEELTTGDLPGTIADIEGIVEAR